MSPEEITAIDKLRHCTMLPGSAEKRFRNDLTFKADHNPDYKLKLFQKIKLWKLTYRYRKQIRDTDFTVNAQKILEQLLKNYPTGKPEVKTVQL